MLVAISGARTPAVVSTVAYGGVSLTFLLRQIEGDRNWTELWHLTSEPVVQTANVVIVTDVADDDLIAGVIVYNGVDQTTPLDTAVGTIGTTANPTINVTSEVDDLVFDSVSGALALTVGAGQTQRHNIDGGGGRTDGASSDEPGAATVTMSWTMAAANWAIVAVNINQAAVGGAVYVVDLLDVFESSSTTLESGISICLNVDLEIAATCGADLVRGRTYRFEVEVDNTGAAAGSPTSLEFRSAVAAGDTLGTIPVGNILNSGCSTNIDWIESIVTTTAIATSGTTCSIPATTGTAEFWMIITIDTDAWDDTSTFFITDGTITDESTITTFTVNEIVTVTDTPAILDSGVRALNVSVTDAPTIADTATRTGSFVRTATNAPAITDSVAIKKRRSGTDIPAITDSTIVDGSFVRTVTDTPTIIDSTLTALNPITVTDTPAITDSTTVSGSFIRTVTDTPAITDSATVSQSRSGTDTPAITDSTTVSGNFVRTATDTPAIIDSTLTALNPITVTDTPAITDSAAVPQSRSGTDTPSITDSATVSGNFVRSVTDTPTIVDSAATGEIRTATDTPSITDSTTITRHFIRSITDTPFLQSYHLQLPSL